ncbi:DASH family cryptochrome [Salinisphaera sp. SPP-AMP-43]|uniref:DASH family cryptochrome n=1 Tax=Salinisphaera sp. SPP-AMP-43 TaxID=3121288 RepID=UPI003C6DEFD5
MASDRSSQNAILWFKNDLRLDDNPALNQAAAADTLVCVYCVDRRFDTQTIFGTPKIGRHRQAFIGESLTALDTELRARGGQLVVCRGEPEHTLLELVQRLGANTVWAEDERAPEELAQLERVRAALGNTAALRTAPDNTLYQANDLPFAVADIPRTYTRFRKAVEKHIAVDAPVAAPQRLPGPPEAAAAMTERFATIDWPSNDTPFVGSECAAHARLDHYFWHSDRIASYKATRNGLLGLDDSSKLSPWLALGCISARRIAAVLADYEDQVVANESTYWLLFELRWREFFHWILAAEGGRLFQRGGLQDRTDRPTAAEPERLQAWQHGRTGLPFIDAGMRELATTGYLSNRARQNVASYLAHDLAQDWRYGAAWFEAQLVDYDAASNWGNWATVAGVGTDKRDQRFDVLAQAERYDPQAAYITYWIPELGALPVAERHRPWQVDADTLAATGYPRIAYPPG